MIKIPNNKKWIQTNRSDSLGNLSSTFNIDTQSNVGALRLSPRLKQVANTTNFANLGVPVAFRWFDTKIWAITGTRIHLSNGNYTDSVPWSEDGSTGAQTDYSADESDMEVFNNTLCATTTDALYSKASDGSGTGAWTSRDTLSAGSPHVVCYFKKYNRLYYTNSNDDIISIDTAWATADPGSDYAISLSGGSSEEYVITAMRANNTHIWIGTHIGYSNKGQPGKIVQWDGISADITAEYALNNAQGVLAIAINPKTQVPFVLDTNGVLSAFNGSGFTEVGRFPLADVPYAVDDRDNERAVHPNGMYFTKNGTLRILFNNRPPVSTDKVIENCPSGIWEWSEENGLLHAYSISYNAVASSTITDYGQNRVDRVGALVSMNIPATTAVDGTMMLGVTAYTDATTTINYIQTDNSLDTIVKNGYFVTTKIFSPNIVEAWQGIAIRFKRLLDSTDKLVVKYRTFESTPVEATITWTSTTTFTTTTDVSGYYDSALSRGYEVEVLQGKGAGKCAHITSIVNNAGTYTVTVDETFTGATSGTAIARFQKWIKIDSIDNQRIDYVDIALKENTPWIQFKVFMQNTGADEVYDLVLTHSKKI